MINSFALAALVAAQGSGVQWAPLNQSDKPAAAAVAQVAPVRPVAGRVLPAGTMVRLTALQEITSKRTRQGQRFQFTVVEDVVEKGAVVIPRGSVATGYLSMKTGRAVGGKSGKFDVTFESVDANGVRFPLSGTHRQEGKGNTLGALFGSLIITGHSATLLPGQVLNAFTTAPTAY